RIEISDDATIGRDPSCTIVIPEESVSRRHARLEIAPDGIRVVDLNSGNGIWIENRRVADVVLQPGHRIRIGSTVLECFEEERALAVAALNAATLLVGRPPADISSLVGAPPRFLIRVLEGGENVHAGEEFIVEQGDATIGRSKDCTVVIDERDVSRNTA